MIQRITNFHQTHPKELGRFLKFATVGFSGAIVDFTILNTLLYLFNDVWQLNLLAQIAFINGNLLVANTISVCTAIVNNFTWNRLWTFPESKVRKKRTQLMQFATINGIGLALNNLIVLAVTAVLMPHLGETLSPNLAKAFAIGIVLFWNFGGNRLWTYRGL